MDYSKMTVEELKSVKKQFEGYRDNPLPNLYLHSHSTGIMVKPQSNIWTGQIEQIEKIIKEKEEEATKPKEHRLANRFATLTLVELEDDLSDFERLDMPPKSGFWDPDWISSCIKEVKKFIALRKEGVPPTPKPVGFRCECGCGCTKRHYNPMGAYCSACAAGCCGEW